MGFLRIVVVVVVSLYSNRPWKLSRLSSHAPVVNVWRASASIRYRRAHPSLWDGKSFNWNVGWNLPASSCWSGTKAGLCRNVGCGPSLRSWGLGHAGLFYNKNCHPLFAPHIYDPQDFTLIDPLPKKIILTPSPLWLCPLTAVNTSSAGTGKSEYSILLAHFRASLMQ